MSKAPELIQISYRNEFNFIWDQYLKVYPNMPKIYAPTLKIHWGKDASTINTIKDTVPNVILGLTDQGFTVYEHYVSNVPESQIIHVWHKNFILAMESIFGSMKKVSLKFLLASMYHLFVHEITHHFRTYRAWAALYTAKTDKEYKKAEKKLYEYMDKLGTIEDEAATEEETMRIFADILFYDNRRHASEGFATITPKYGSRYHRWLVNHDKSYKYSFLAVEYYKQTMAMDPRLAMVRYDDACMSEIIEEYKKEAAERPVRIKFVK